MKVSVLLPCRNAEGTLRDCLRSLARQTFRDFEVVAVEDDSDDATPGILRRAARADDRVRVVPGPGEGIVPALQRGVEEARGELLARMDADDLAHGRRLELQVRELEARPGLAACGTGVRFFPRARLGSGMRRYEGWLNSLIAPEEVRRDLFVECPVAHPALMMRREVLDDAGGYRDPGWPEDYDLILRLHRAGARCGNLERRLHLWRLGPDRLSARSPRYSPDAFRRCRVHHLLRGFLPEDRPVVVWGAGSVGKGFGRELKRQGGRLDAWVDLDPRKVGQRIHGAPVLNPEGFGAWWEDPAAGPAPDRTAPPYVLAAVGTPGARGEIMRFLDGAGLSEIRDYRAVA